MIDHIHTQTHQDNIDSILNPTYLPDPPPLSLPPDSDADDGSSNGAPAATGKRGIPFAPPPHPDIINCGPAFRTGKEDNGVCMFLADQAVCHKPFPFNTYTTILYVHVCIIAHLVDKVFVFQ